MAESLALDLFSKRLLTDSVVLTIGYDVENLQDPVRRAAYRGKVVTDHYGRQVPVHGHGTERLGKYSYSMSCISEAFLRLYDRISDDALLVRRLTLAAEHVLPRDRVPQVTNGQLDLFALCEEPSGVAEPPATYNTSPERELDMQRAMLSIRDRYGKNAIFKGANLEKDSTALQRNAQIGGHQA
jgi:DNA polymerase V